MELAVYSVHHKPGHHVEVIPDRFDVFALALPLIWAIWHGLWVVLAALATVMGLAWIYSPVAPMIIMYAVGLVFAFESGAVRRLELRIRGWQDRGTVQAASPEGAEEAFLNGHAV